MAPKHIPPATSVTAGRIELGPLPFTRICRYKHHGVTPPLPLPPAVPVGQIPILSRVIHCCVIPPRPTLLALRHLVSANQSPQLAHIRQPLHGSIIHTINKLEIRESSEHEPDPWPILVVNSLDNICSMAGEEVGSDIKCATLYLRRINQWSNSFKFDRIPCCPFRQIHTQWEGNGGVCTHPVYLVSWHANVPNTDREEHEPRAKLHCLSLHPMSAVPVVAAVSHEAPIPPADMSLP